MVNKTPGSATWDLASRSHQLWKTLVQSIEEQGLDPMVELGWKQSGITIIAVSFYKFLFLCVAIWEYCQCESLNLKLYIYNLHLLIVKHCRSCVRKMKFLVVL